ncbi:hypothetical protein [Neptuniibacter sp. QD34_54]|uniref:hypothetical protein n=1 Tax=Neptuniibacter sp. QD34_54 TaxID=3398208 RepID=UPI0039F5538A
MYTLAKILNFLMASLFTILGIAALLMGNFFAPFFPVDLAIVMSILPFLVTAMGIVGLWSIFTNNRSWQIAFSLFTAMFWYIGTIIGVLSLILLLASKPSEEETTELPNPTA